MEESAILYQIEKAAKSSDDDLTGHVFSLEDRFIIYLFIYTLFYVDIYNKKHKNIVIYTTHYVQIAIQMVFNKQICMLIYVNQNNSEKMNRLKRNFNIKNINIKHLRITNYPLIENSSTRKPGKQNLHLPSIYC